MSSHQILVHRSDSQIDAELRQALASVSGFHPVLHFQGEVRDSIAAAAAFQPSLVMVQIDEDLELTGSLIEECIAAAPDTTVVGIYSGGNDRGESALMMRALRLGVEDFVRRPISTTDLSSLLARRLQRRREKRVTPGLMASFISNKGGVGKSTMAVNSAVELAMRFPERVLLVDGSLQMGVCATHLDIKPQATLVDAWNERERLDSQLLKQLTMVHESGLHLLAAPDNAVEAAEVDEAFISRVLLLARRCYDYILVDTFPLFDRTIMTILDLSDISFIVAENVVPTLQTIRGFFQLLRDVEFPEDRWRVLLNRYSTASGAPAIAEVERYLGHEVDHVVPFDRKVLLSANTGKPLMMSGLRWSKSVRAIKEVVNSIEQLHDQGVASAAASTVNARTDRIASADPNVDLGLEGS